MTASPPPSPAHARRSVTKEARTRASVETVWPLIGEARRWKEWSFLDRSELIAEGDPAPDGVGALRRFTRFGVGSTERVLAWDPPRHLAYTMVKGFPVRNYRADVTCTAEAEGTLITWSASFDPLVPGTGPVMQLVLGRLLGGFADGVAHHADRLSGSPQASAGENDPGAAPSPRP